MTNEIGIDWLTRDYPYVCYEQSNISRFSFQTDDAGRTLVLSLSPRVQAGPTGGVTSGAAPKCGQATRAILKMSCPVLGFSRRDRIGGGGISAILRTLMLSSTSVVGRGAEASWRERPERARRERASWSERHKARGFIHSRRASTRTKRSSDPLAESRN